MDAAGIPVWRAMGAVPPPPGRAERAGVVIVGAGPVGLAMALDLGRRGHDVIVLALHDFIAAGSKAICFAKRSLDIFDALGVGDAIVDKGVVWNVGKVFRGNRAAPVLEFDVLPVKDQKRPGFINIQQYHVEERLVEALATLPNVALRWGHRLAGLEARDDGATLSVETAEGSYAIHADWVVACDGSRSAARALLGLDFDGRVFEDNFLIADIRIKGKRPAERWFWFDPPFFAGQSALIHKQPDDVWRLDFQLGWDVDRAAAVLPENVEPLVRGMLGADVAFEREWYSVYTFQCRRMARFVHGRVIFAGDSAHLVSPFGARGCNGGLADVANLGWKLDLVLRGAGGPGLLDSYDAEAGAVADENIRASSRSTDFMTPKSAVSRIFRDAVLELAAELPFAAPFVNSGRLSTAVALAGSALNSPDRDDWRGTGLAPGSPALDARIGEGWLLDRLGDDFVLLADGWRGGALDGIAVIDAAGAGGPFADRYALAPGRAYLVRPDQYVCARWHTADRAAVLAALARAKGN
ncbi:FAD-dependent oxidoreductase [uncultured Sphingomonas sp.]|uniref:FAD-dependent oxidoreductase n=1 Tax=uncultured Sphingomonas sp. TaxID=158754 RepID=UPI0035C9FBB4